MWQAMARILKGGLEVAPGVLWRFQWEHGQESENTGTAVNFGIEQKASGGLHRTETRSWRQ
jgi:hypothetical protein